MKARIVPAMSVLLVDSRSKLSMDDYDRLQAGMSYEEVKGILGNPHQCSEMLGVKACTWGNQKRNIKVNVLGNQALLFSA